MIPPVSPLRAPFDYDIVTPDIAAADANRASFGPGGGFAQEAAAGLRRFADGVSTRSLSTQALDAELGNDPAAVQRLLAARDRVMASGAGSEAAVPEFTGIRSVSDVADWAGSTLGEGVPSMAPVLAAGLLSRAALARKLGTGAATAAGAIPMAYSDIRSGEVDAQYSDPALAQASPEERSRVATQTALGGAALEALVPGRIAAGMARGRVGKAVLEEGLPEALTEAGQGAISQVGQMQLDENRDFSVEELVNAGAAGGLVGTAVGSAARALPAAGPIAAAPAAAPVDLGPPDTAPPTDPMQPVDLGGGSGNIITDTVARMQAAIGSVQSPGDFLRAVFAGKPEEQAAMDLQPDTEDPRVMSAADPAAAIQQRDVERQQRAAGYAEALLNSETVPPEMKARVAEFAGDYSSPEAQDFVTRSLVAASAGERVTQAADTLVELAKSGDRVTRSNLQDTTPAEQAVFNKLVFDGLTDEAKSDPAIRERLPELANAMLAFATRTGELTKADIKTLSKLQDGLALFNDPEQFAAQLTEYAGIPRLDDSFLSRIQRVTNAQQDIRKPNSFLYTALSKDAKSNLSTTQLGKLARLVDEFTLADSSKAQGDKVLAGLAAAFGSKDAARTVLDYYQQQNRADLQFDESEFFTQVGATEREGAPAATFTFADPKAQRPFRTFAGRMSTQDGMRARRRESTLAGVELRRSAPSAVRVRPAPMSEYVAETGKDPEAEVKRLAADLKGRIEQQKARKGEDRSQQVGELEGELALVRRTYKAGGAKAALDLYEVLRSSDQEQSDTVATDSDISAFSKLLESETRETAADIRRTKVTFQRADGSRFSLSAESMWKTQGDKEGSGRGENARTRAKRLFADAVASVLARPEVAKLVTPMGRVTIDRAMKLRARPAPDPEYRELVSKALGDAEGSLKTLGANLDRIVDEFLENTDESRRAEIEDVIQQNIDRLEERQKTLTDNQPALVVARQRMRLYREAQAQIDAVKFDEEFDERDNNRSGVPGAEDMPPDFSSDFRRLERQRADLQHAYDVAYDSGDPAAIESAERALADVKERIEGVEAREAVARSYGPAGWTAREGRGAGPRYYEEDTGLGVGVERTGGSKNRTDRTKNGTTPSKPRLPPTLAGQRVGAGIEAMVDGFRDGVDSTEAAKKFRDIVRTVVGDIAKIVTGDSDGTHMQAARFDVTDNGAEISLFLDNLEFSDATPEEAAHHEAAHAVVQIVQQQYGRDVAKRVVDLADKPYIREQITELTGFTAAYFQTSPEELFAQTYALWATDRLRLKAEPRLTRIFNRIKELLGRISDDQLLSDVFASMRDGDFQNRLDVLTKEAFAERMDSSGDFFVYNDEYKVTPEVVQRFMQAFGYSTAEIDPEALLDKEVFTVASAIAYAGGTREERLEAMSELLGEVVTPKKSSAVAPDGTGPLSAAEQKSIRAEIFRMRGNQIKVVFAAAMKGSGEFSMGKDKTNRLITIALNAANPMGVAWHESLHDFFAMLDETPVHRRIKKDLVAAADAPHVKKRLRELLAKHPKALEQIENSAEERVAYMFQFWAEGLLQVGPTGTGIFQRLRQMFRELLGVVGTTERAEQLLAALHDGEFADPSTVAEVLADLPGDRLSNKMEIAAPALTGALNKVFSAAPDRLRAFQNDSLNTLADMFSSETGKLGFIQRRFQQQGRWDNARDRVLLGTTSVERRAALDNMQAMKPPSTDLERKLVDFFGRMHDYMVDAGVQTFDSATKKWVPLRKVTNYFPRAFDRNAITADRDAFQQLLVKHGKMSASQAAATADALVHGTGQLELVEDEHSLGFTPYAQAVQDRKMTFINATNAADFAKYQVKDLADITTGYVRQAVHRGEYSRTFGNQGERITQLITDSGIRNEAELAEIGRTVQALEGSLDPGHWSSSTKELMSGVLTLQNLVVLPLSLFSQMIDPIVLAARTGSIRDAGDAYVTAVKRLVGKEVDGEEMANMLGIISQDSVLEAMGNAYGTVQMSKRMRDINRMFFKYNGMQGWNNSMRIAATAAGERYLLANRKDAKVLAELGLTPKDIVTKPGSDRLDVSSPKLQEAMYRFVDQAALRPSASSRPVWMSDPRFLLVAHLKQFTFAMHNVILKRANRELANDNPKPWAVLALAMPVVLAADMAKFALMGGLPSSWGFMDYVSHAVERSGLLGLGDFGAQALRGVDTGSVPGERLLGPTFEHLMELLRWVGGDARTGLEDVVDRTVPGARFV